MLPSSRPSPGSHPAVGGTSVLLVFARWPEPGRAKTRLIPALGAGGAAALHRELVEHTLSTARTTRRLAGCRLEVCIDGASPDAFQRWLGGDVAFTPQGGGSLGDRLAAATARWFEAGAARVVVIGTDSPDLTPFHIRDALAALDDHDAAIGPALDGGYYLLALRRPVPELFDGVPWGEPEVLTETLARARGARLAVALLPPLADVDRPGDLAVWERARGRRR